MKAYRAELGLSVDTELKSKSLWQISLDPLLQVIKEPAGARAPRPVGAVAPLVWLVVDWDTPAKKQQTAGT